MDKPEADLLGLPGQGMWGSVPEPLEREALKTYWLQRGSRPVKLLALDPPLPPATVERFEKIDNPYYHYRDQGEDQSCSRARALRRAAPSLGPPRRRITGTEAAVMRCVRAWRPATLAL